MNCRWLLECLCRICRSVGLLMMMINDDDDSLNAAIELVFVKWANPIEREGRTVRVVDSRVVYDPSMMFGRPVPSSLFTGPQNEVLINCIGACSRRQRGNLRDELPELVQRFFSFAGISTTYANKAFPFLVAWCGGHTCTSQISSDLTFGCIWVAVASFQDQDHVKICSKRKYSDFRISGCFIWVFCGV